MLGVLLRYPQALVERLADDEPLDCGGDRRAPALAAGHRARRRWRRCAARGKSRWRASRGAISPAAPTSSDARRRIDARRVPDPRRARLSRRASLEPRFGRPRDAAGSTLPLLVLGMGKLGGGELNFSSDVDLVFVYPDGAVAGCDDESSAETYYLRLAQLLIKLLDQRTDDGFVYRVDTRLRPFGASGPLVVEPGCARSYLVEHGRDWERYAYVKARLLTGSGTRADAVRLHPRRRSSIAAISTTACSTRCGR